MRVLFNRAKYGNSKSKAWVLIHRDNPTNKSDYEVIPHDQFFKVPAETLNCRDEFVLKFSDVAKLVRIVATSCTASSLQFYFHTLRRNYLRGTEALPGFEFLLNIPPLDIDAIIPSTNNDNPLLETPIEASTSGNELNAMLLDITNFVSSARLKLDHQLSKEDTISTVINTQNAALKIFEYKCDKASTYSKEVKDWRVKAPPTKILPTDNEYDFDKSNPNIYFGVSKTAVPREVYKTINWLDGSQATRKLLICLFTREELATHTLSGKPRPGSTTDVIKAQLNPKIVEDIITHLVERTHFSRPEIRQMITAKCADENKMYKKRLKEAKTAKKVTNPAKRKTTRQTGNQSKKGNRKKSKVLGVEFTDEIDNETEAETMIAVPVRRSIRNICKKTSIDANKVTDMEVTEEASPEIKKTRYVACKNTPGEETDKDSCKMTSIQAAHVIIKAADNGVSKQVNGKVTCTKPPGQETNKMAAKKHRIAIDHEEGAIIHISKKAKLECTKTPIKDVAMYAGKHAKKMENAPRKQIAKDNETGEIENKPTKTTDLVDTIKVSNVPNQEIDIKSNDNQTSDRMMDEAEYEARKIAAEQLLNLKFMHIQPMSFTINPTIVHR